MSKANGTRQSKDLGFRKKGENIEILNTLLILVDIIGILGLIYIMKNLMDDLNKTYLRKEYSSKDWWNKIDYNTHIGAVYFTLDNFICIFDSSIK